MSGSPMGFNENGVKIMIAQKELKTRETPRVVIRGVHSQTQANEVGVHWLRISILYKYLEKIRAYCNLYFGDSTKDGYGLWSYDTRYSWSNGASLNFDSEQARCDKVHKGKVTLDIPGGALDTINQTDLHLFLLSLRQFRPSCTRIDIFFDDYNRVITPDSLKRIVKKKDFSGYRYGQTKQRHGIRDGSWGLIHDEVDFGKRGKGGGGRYMRIYDKLLESEGEKDCVRWEVEFSKERAHKVFDKLSQTDSVDAFGTLCGALIGGSIVFVHRNGEKNIGRLEIYSFWKQIVDLLGVVVVRVPEKNTNISGKCQWVYKQVSPTLASLRETFVTDSDFFSWMFDVLSEGETRMSQRQTNFASEHKRLLHFIDGEILVNNRGVYCNI